MLLIRKTCESKQMYIDASSENSLPDFSMMFLDFSSLIKEINSHPSPNNPFQIPPRQRLSLASQHENKTTRNKQTKPKVVYKQGTNHKYRTNHSSHQHSTSLIKQRTKSIFTRALYSQEYNTKHMLKTQSTKTSSIRGN